MRLAALLVFALACSSSTSGPKMPPEPKTVMTNTPAQTGPLTEEEFKALHAPPTAGPVKVNGQMIEIKGTKAYLSLPAGKGPFPAIVVIHEWWGLNANIEHWADRLASAGWAAVAIDLYNGAVTDTQDAAMAAMKNVDPVKAAATIKAAVDFIGSDPRIAATKRAVIGWCFGGGWSLQAGLANPELDGVIMYYGQLETDPAKLSVIKGKLLGVFGKQDKGIPPEAVAKFDAALGEANVPHEIYEYEAPHAFANPSNPKYDETSAAEAWKHVLAFLDKLREGA